MSFINKLFNSIACLLYFINLQLVIPGRTWILLYLGRTVYKRLWACLALFVYLALSYITYKSEVLKTLGPNVKPRSITTSWRHPI